MPPTTYPVARSASARSASVGPLGAEGGGHRLEVGLAGHRHDGDSQVGVGPHHERLEHPRRRHSQCGGRRPAVAALVVEVAEIVHGGVDAGAPGGRRGRRALAGHPGATEIMFDVGHARHGEGERTVGRADLPEPDAAADVEVDEPLAVGGELGRLGEPTKP